MFYFVSTHQWALHHLGLFVFHKYHHPVYHLIALLVPLTVYALPW